MFDFIHDERFKMIYRKGCTEMETSEHSVPLQAHQNNLLRFLHNEILLELIDFHTRMQF